MLVPRASVRVIRSIRQISLTREWARLRGTHRLPNLSDFEPDSRAGDSQELGVNEVVWNGDGFRLLVHQAGDRTERAVGSDNQGKYLDEILPPHIIAHSQPYWHAAITQRLPVYKRLGIKDAEDNQCTLEHLYMPFSANRTDSHYIVAHLQVFSEHGSYALDGLFQAIPNVDFAPEAYLIDPAQALVDNAINETDIELI